MWRYIISLFVVIICYQTAVSQDTLVTDKDTLIQKSVITGIRFGYDLLGPVATYYKGDSNVNYTKYEFTGDIGIKKMFVVFDYGYGAIERTNTGFNYKNSGNYFRIGIDKNLFKDVTSKNVFFVGIRYGKSFFKEEASYTVKNSYYGDYSGTISRNNLSASWGEFAIGMKIFIIKNFYLGYTLRYKVRFKIRQPEGFNTFDIPGYGIAQKTGIFGFNYYVMYRIPFK